MCTLFPMGDVNGNKMERMTNLVALDLNLFDSVLCTWRWLNWKLYVISPCHKSKRSSKPKSKFNCLVWRKKSLVWPQLIHSDDEINHIVARLLIDFSSFVQQYFRKWGCLYNRFYSLNIFIVMQFKSHVLFFFSFLYIQKPKFITKQMPLKHCLLFSGSLKFFGSITKRNTFFSCRYQRVSKWAQQIRK